MLSTTNLQLVNFVKKLLDLIFGFLIVGSVLLILWMVISPLILTQGETYGSTSVQVMIGAEDEARFEVTLDSPDEALNSPVYMEETQGTLRIETTNWSHLFISNFAKLLTAFGIAYAVYLLRSVLGAILEGEPFVPENGVRIRRIGYLVLLLSFLYPIIQYIAANEILNQLPITNPTLSPGSPFKAELILVSLFILILAQVWSYGWELEHERSLTI
jgi:hypothetical protein